ncbi:hypothetical protein IKT18_02295 [Candidatus Saccharibacteria bacterium]|nr:hypothetical protein [Candidatus Saccharibacteria bacterium]
MVKLLKPAIERRLEKASSSIGTRKRIAEDVCRFLEAKPEDARNMPLEREHFYSACESLLEDRDYRRILLYLPLGLLEYAPAAFKETYLHAWFQLLGVSDVRENFHFGDCFELDARPLCGLDRVVKCAHLTPWLLKFGYISARQLQRALEHLSDDEVLLQSFKDTWEYIRKRQILDAPDLLRLTSLTDLLPERKRQEPLYVSKKRLDWLNEPKKKVELLTPTAKLEGPFSDNIPAFEDKLQKIIAQLASSEIVLVGGSQLKGYGATDSDLDIWHLDSLKEDSAFRPGSPHAVHVYFNTIWLGGRAIVDKLEDIANDITSIYTDSEMYNSRSEFRRQAIERLESDLLLYRLLHKGFSRFTGKTEYSVPSEMDGDCPFYSDEYRRIATMLYAKYVWL